MKVLFLSPYFYPHVGGVETHVLEVAKNLSRKGFELSVISQRVKDESKDYSVSGIKVYKIELGSETFFKKFRIWKEIWKRRHLIENSDIIHCHDVFFWYLPFRFLYPRKRVYTTFHGYEGNFPPSWKAVVVRKISEKLSWGNIIVGSFIKKWYGTNPTHITYGASTRTKLKPHPNYRKLRVLLIGRLEKDIGIDIYLQTLRFLKEKRIEFSLTVLGDGSFRNELKKFGNVHGFVKNVEPYLQRADIVFASSYLSIIQGMVLRKPVFAVYDNLLKKDYLDMTPFREWIVIKNSSRGILSEIENYLRSSKEFNKRLNEAYNWAYNQTWEKVTKIYLNLYK